MFLFNIVLVTHPCDSDAVLTSRHHASAMKVALAMLPSLGFRRNNCVALIFPKICLLLSKCLEMHVGTQLNNVWLNFTRFNT